MDEDLIRVLVKYSRENQKGIPNKKDAESFIDSLFELLFTPSKEKISEEDKLAEKLIFLQKMLESILFDIIADGIQAEKISAQFFKYIPLIVNTLQMDAEAFVKFDPAAGGIEEVLLAYPGFYAISIYRFSNILQKAGVPVLPRIWSEFAHSKTGIDIHPGASIGKSFFIDHGTGVVIGESTVIGNNVVVYQGVTLGALHVSKELASVKRHPTIEDNVIIYSGATILGGATVVGKNSIIGGNVWLTESVLPSSLVYQKSEIIVRDKTPGQEPINFVI